MRAQLKGGGTGGIRYQQSVANYAERIGGIARTMGVCARCTDIIESKKASGKYRPMKQPAKCAGCGQKAVNQAYCTFCQQCGSSKRKCLRCGDPFGARKPDGSGKTNEIAQIQAQLEQPDLRERERRTLLRKLEKAKAQRVEHAKAVREGKLPPLQAAEDAAQESADDGDDGSDGEEGDEGNGRTNEGGAAPMSHMEPLKYDKDAPLVFEFGGSSGTGLTAFGSLSVASVPAEAGQAGVGGGAAAADGGAEAGEAAADDDGQPKKKRILSELLAPAAVDMAFEAAWPAFLDAVSAPQIAASEAAFDAICASMSESEADRRSDLTASVAATAAAGQEDASGALAMLREALRWRAARYEAGGRGGGGSTSSGQAVEPSSGGGAEEARVLEEAAEAAAEDAARVLHQLLSMSKSWGLMNRWQAGVLVQVS